MTTRLTAAEASFLLSDPRRRAGRSPKAASKIKASRLLAKPKRSKYRNEPTVYDGVSYASKAEARHAAELDLQKRSGLIRGWAAHVSLPLPGTERRMIVDFLIVTNDGRLRLEDVKGGIITRDWQLKRELLETSLGVNIEIVR